MEFVAFGVDADIQNITVGKVLRMTALEYMEKQVQKHRNNLDRELARNAPKETIFGVITKIRYYVDAVEALKKVGNGNA